jgi:hypothetical protein
MRPGKDRLAPRESRAEGERNKRMNAVRIEA